MHDTEFGESMGVNIWTAFAGSHPIEAALGAQRK
jgi:hypothetical protein